MVIPLDQPDRSIDVGESFTIEFWLRALPGENTRIGCQAQADGWIEGNILVDRDVYGPGDRGDYGISISNGRIAFGVHNGSTGATICGTTDVTTGDWHHVAVTRASSGHMAVFVDGVLDGQVEGPTGDLSYRNGRTTAYPNSDPYLVIGAEKHDVGAEYPAFRGWLDELRISRSVRYTAEFTPPIAPFTPDDATVALYHCDQGTGDVLSDASLAGNDGQLRIGGNPAGPQWSPITPWQLHEPLPMPTILPTQAAAARPADTPAAAATAISTPIPEQQATVVSTILPVTPTIRSRIVSQSDQAMSLWQRYGLISGIIMVMVGVATVLFIRRQKA